MNTAAIATKRVRHPDCGGEDNCCMVANARGEHCRCQGECAYSIQIPKCPYCGLFCGDACAEIGL